MLKFWMYLKFTEKNNKYANIFVDVDDKHTFWWYFENVNGLANKTRLKKLKFIISFF